ncbi:M13 family metallopeptidase [Ferruginibacter sp. HRS2-29]|uniref:M13 family metallopeptidase n=1 Tax=Ferruginibacter sp. HRS2-29 TaxID=2487334 RepID=UPI0020CBDBDF|nr:M13 family metallopeptidase [Ferruginibacter sp. HRS2-29]
MKKLLLTLLAFGAITCLHAQMKYIDRANMDTTIKPGDDFYTYANGTWIKNNPVPASRTRWGSFDLLREESSKRLRSLLDDAVQNRTRDRKTQIIADVYSSGMDSITLDKKGNTPIRPLLTRIDGVKNTGDVLKEAAILRTTGAGSPFFGMFIGPDRKNVRKYIPSISFGGTSMADRDYYLKTDPRSTRIREAYKVYLNKLFTLAGESEAAAAASATAVLNIETVFAKAQYSRVEMRDPYKTYNKFSVKDLTALAPVFDWKTLLQEMKVKGADSVLLNNPGLLKTADSMLKAVPLADWKSYLRWNVIRNAAPYLSNGFVEADFAFTQVQTGQKQITPRWQRMSSLIDSRLGDLIGQLYVEKYFRPEAKARMLELVNNLQSTFADRIKKLDWMTDATKQRALEKLNAFAKKIAYPDKWKEYEGLTVSKDDFYGNVRNTATWSYNYNVNKMGKPVDRTEMGMTPPTINASYSSTNNDLTFPAGILQFPFFDFGADDAVNYGGIGAVIGHEMTHGFDDQGRQSDAIGNLNDWWAQEDGDKFKLKADEVVQQYNAFTVLDTVHVNGKLTLGENLADLGGLSIAYEAFTHTKEYKENKLIDGFTPSQRFFLSWAQVWRNNVLPDNAAQLIVTDPHSPGIHRGNGPIVNIDAWYDAFNIQPGDKMYKKPESRTRIW